MPAQHPPASSVIFNHHALTAEHGSATHEAPTDVTPPAAAGLAVIWLAATLGPRATTTHSVTSSSSPNAIHASSSSSLIQSGAAIGKQGHAAASGVAPALTKKQLNRVNIGTACDYIVSAQKTLALRLSSNLMMGVTRVYSHQYQFFSQDVTATYNRIKRSLYGSGGIHFGAKDAPTLSATHLEMQQAMAKYESITCVLEEDLALLAAPNPLTLAEQDPIDAPLSQNTPFSAMYTQSIHDHTISSSTTSSFASMPYSLISDLGGHMGGLSSLTAGTPSGHHHGSSFLATSPPRPGALDVLSSSVDDLLFLDDPHSESRQQLDIFAEILQDQMVRKRARLDFDSSSEDEESAGTASQSSITSIASSQPLADEAVDFDVGRLDSVIQNPQPELQASPIRPKQGPKKRRAAASTALIDDGIELSHADMVANRAGFDAYLTGLAAAHAQKRQDREDKAIATALINTYHPVQAFYGDLGYQLGRLFAPAGIKDVPAKGGRKSKKSVMDKASLKEPSSPSSSEHARVLPDAGNDENTSLEDTGTGEETSSIEIELARAARASDLVMPWHRAASSVGQLSTPGRHSMGQEGMDTSWSASMGFSAGGSGGGHSSLGMDESPLARPLPETLPLFSNNPAFIPQSVEGLDNDTIDFYAYMMDIMTHAKSSCVHFFDLMPVQAHRVTGARAFMNVLILSTKGLIQPHQSVAYGDIQLTPILRDTDHFLG